MKKSILNLGKALNRAEQKEVFGGESFKREGDCHSTTEYMDTCPFSTSNSDGGCWVIVTDCGGGLN